MNAPRRNSHVAQSAALCLSIVIAAGAGCSDDNSLPVDLGAAEMRVDAAVAISGDSGADAAGADLMGDAAPASGWVKAYSGQIGDMTVDQAGNIYVVGQFSGTAAFGKKTLTSKGDVDAFVLKLSGAGEVQWVVGLGGAGEEGALGVAVDSAGGVHVAGYFSSTAAFGSTNLTSKGLEDLYVAKLDSTGTVTWAKSIGSGSYDGGTDIALDGKGNSIVVGGFDLPVLVGGKILKSAGLWDVLVVRYDANGAVTWATTMGGSGEDIAWGVAVDSSQNIIVGGGYQGAATFGSKTVTAKGADDGFVSLLNGAGVVQWTTSLGGVTSDVVNDVAAGPKGEIVVTGIYSGTSSFGTRTLTASGNDSYVARLDKTGKVLWAKGGGGTGANSGQSVTLDASGNIVAVGGFEASLGFGGAAKKTIGKSDVYIVELDGAGKLTDLTTGGGGGHDWGVAVTVDKAGVRYVAGSFAGPATFAGTTLTPLGTHLFVWKQ